MDSNLVFHTLVDRMVVMEDSVVSMKAVETDSSVLQYSKRY